jgi:hypothetical protein
VPEEDSQSPEMKDLTSTSFGYIIAFLLPGIFGLYALSYWFPQMGLMLQPILKADSTVGPSVVFLLIALGIGLCVSAARFFLFEQILCRKHKLPLNMFVHLIEDGKLSFFKAVVDEHYRYHQFYGGCAVAFLILFIGWLRGHLQISWYVSTVSIGFVILELMLVSSGRQSYIRFVERSKTIVDTQPKPTKQMDNEEAKRND